MYKIVYTHFDPNDMLGEYNTIVLEEKKKRFKTFEEAVNYIKVSEKRNITKKYREENGECYLDYIINSYGENRFTLDVIDLFSDEQYERYEYLIIKI